MIAYECQRVKVPPVFENLPKVLGGSGPSRQTLFEFFLNRPSVPDSPDLPSISNS